MPQMNSIKTDCKEFEEDPYITDDLGEPKGQCVCGCEEHDHGDIDPAPDAVPVPTLTPEQVALGFGSLGEYL